MARRLVQGLLRHPWPAFSSAARKFPTGSVGIPLFSRVCEKPPVLFPRQPWMLTTVHHYKCKRKRKNPKDPYVWIKVGDDEPCPVSQPNKGSVKNRKHKKRMEQRQAFRAAEVRKSIRSCKAARKRKLAARHKRWKEAGERARAWAAKKAAEAEAAAQQNVSSIV